MPESQTAVVAPVEPPVRRHTPGPWRPHFEEAYFVTGPDLGRVAMMMKNLKGAHGLGGRRSGDESAANCRLIAAAPDMLNALRSLLRHAERVNEVLAQECGVRFVDEGPLMMARNALERAVGDA